MKRVPDTCRSCGRYIVFEEAAAVSKCGHYLRDGSRISPVKHASGAGTSHIALRYDLIPRELKDVLAQRYTLGAGVYGPYAYRKGLRDRGFIVDRIGHIHEHLSKLFQPLPGDAESFTDNLGAIGWGIGFLAEVWADPQGRAILESLMRGHPDG